ncbi:Hypothetical predicted protein [Podarcis lilfordi]|uniref:Uncharacterized protein n=1 Tax=Podarcis lilfordi TaxID=74358 RepID=A0AA35KE01_9SAUR|nr:Hypothetical predicted protein [Podarcis lilfordi]
MVTVNLSDTSPYLWIVQRKEITKSEKAPWAAGLLLSQAEDTPTGLRIFVRPCDQGVDATDDNMNGFKVSEGSGLEATDTNMDGSDSSEASSSLPAFAQFPFPRNPDRKIN